MVKANDFDMRAPDKRDRIFLAQAGAGLKRTQLDALDVTQIIYMAD